MAEGRDLSKLEELGIIHAFEFTHELAWNVLKDYLEEQGVAGIIGPKDACREVFKIGVITGGGVWTDMIKARMLISHTSDPVPAKAIIEDIVTRFHPAFQQMSLNLSQRRQLEVDCGSAVQT